MTSDMTEDEYQRKCAAVKCAMCGSPALGNGPENTVKFKYHCARCCKLPRGVEEWQHPLDHEDCGFFFCPADRVPHNKQAHPDDCPCEDLPVTDSSL